MSVRGGVCGRLRASAGVCGSGRAVFVDFKCDMDRMRAELSVYACVGFVFGGGRQDMRAREGG